MSLSNSHAPQHEQLEFEVEYQQVKMDDKWKTKTSIELLTFGK